MSAPELLPASLPFPGLAPAPQCSSSVGDLKTEHSVPVPPHWWCVQGKDHFPGPAGHTVSGPGQGAIGLIGHLGTLLVCVQLDIDPHLLLLLH